jgi:hypothetical protein
MFCNGATVSSSTYPELYAAIGTRFGGNATSFALPDFRGRFLRGSANTSSGVGVSQGWSTAMPTNRFTTDSVSVDHTHPYSDLYLAESHGGQGGSQGGGGSNINIPWGAWMLDGGFDMTLARQNDGDNQGYNSGYTLPRTTNTSSATAHTHTISGGDSETRPNNVAVNWIIKVSYE